MRYPETKMHAHWIPPEVTEQDEGEWELFDSASCQHCVPVTVIETAALEKLRGELQKKRVEQHKFVEPEDGWLFTSHRQALEFLSGRMRYAGVSNSVASSYAYDIDHLLARTLKTAKQRFDECGAAEEEDPVERLRFFCSLAMSPQDWLDVEPFFDALSNSKPI